MKAQTIRDGTGIDIGAPVLVRYWDHVFFKDSEFLDEQKPREMKAAGILDYEDDQVVRLIWEYYDQPKSSGPPRERRTGLTILKNTIIEVKRLDHA